MLRNLQRCSAILCLFVIFQVTPFFLNAQINTPAGATIPFGSNTTYSGAVLLPTNLPSNGTYDQAQDAADAYNHWKTTYVESCGGSPERFRVKFDNPSETVSEGIAYGMLLSAYAADKALFDGLWTYYKNFMDSNGVMNWKTGACSGLLGFGGATDAELDAAMALLVAAHQWPNSSSPHNYNTDATALINAIKTYEIQPTNANGPYQANNGDNWGFGNDCRNPSYQSPAFYKAYGAYNNSQSSFWDNCVQASYTLLNANAHATTGLVSNWSDPSGNANSCNGPNEYGWDACRNPWRMGTAVAWYSDSEASALCNKMAAWMQGVGVSNLRGPLPQNGTGGAYHSPAFISTWAVAVMGANSSYQNLLNSLYTETVATVDSPPFYFGNTLRTLSLFNLTGNFWNPFGVSAPPPQAPFVSITNPSDGTSIQLGNNITITATAIDNDGSIANLLVDIDGTPIPSSNTNGNTYEATWTPSSTGTYAITVTATDNEGMITSVDAMVSITDDPPVAGDYNYGEVLQKSLFFYEVQQSGTLSAGNRVHWRGDSGLEDGSDANLDLTGGWYDAGDHVKFGFPMAYSATMLAWSGVEDEAAYASIGQWDYLKDNLRFVNDYLIKCHIRNGDGSTNKFYGQVGNGSADHAWWGPAEVMQMNRPSYFVDAANPGSDLTGETAAAMAAASMVFATDDPIYSAELLDNAIALYNFADTYRGKYSDAITDATAFYNSWSGYQDELVWGAIWLYRATNDPIWLTKAQTEYQNLSTEQGSGVPSYHWTLAWDDKAYGCYALMAQLTGQQNYKDDTERWLDFWSTGYNGDRINYSPGGQAHLSTWGSLRYAANTAFVALVYSDVIAGSNPTKSQTYKDFGTTQINYALGSNPNNRSYVAGFGNNPPINPHHRTAHGSWANSINTPTNNRHILYGALVGGPDGPDDQYTDDRSDFIANEVACDYNAGFTGAIANLLGRFGGSALPGFPQPEVYDVCEEYYNEAKINASSNTFTEIAVWATNHSAWPATETDQVCYRYFVDISEGIAGGYTAGDYTITINTAPNGTTASPLTQWDGTVYYVEVCFPNISLFPGGQSESHKEAQLRIALPNNAPSSAWDASNDWSYSIEDNTSLDNTLRINPRIPFYNNGELLCGELPTGGNQNHNPVADIMATPIAGNAPLTVSFDASGSTDSDNDVLTYAWDFADGNTGSGLTENHTFTIPGIYMVTLTVNDGNGGIDSEAVNITVIDASPQPPTAVLLANPTNGGAPLSVSLDASGSTDPNGDNLTYSWDFGDGNSSTTAVVNHIYTLIGTYTAALTVNDGNGGIDNQTVIINVTNTAPIAAFTATPTSGQPPLEVTFDAANSSDSNGDNLTYSWDFGDGSSGSGVTATHVYTNEGSYTTILTVDDGNGGTDTHASTIMVSLTTCNLVLKYKTPDTNTGSTTDNQIRAHFRVNNEGEESIDLQDITIRYWYTKDGPQDEIMAIDYAKVGKSNVITNFVEMPSPVDGADHYLEVGFTAGAGSIGAGGNSGTVQTRFHKTNWSNYDENDDYSFNTAFDSFQTWEKVTVYCNGTLAWGIEPDGSSGGPTNTAPIAVMNATPTSGTIPLAVAFDASSSSDADNDALTYAWNFGDGNTGTGVTVNHTYTTAGNFTATLIVNDGNGGSDSEDLTIQVAALPTPIACFTATPTSGTAPLAVAFDAGCSTHPTGEALTYIWDFGDGDSGVGSTTNHTYQNEGSYTTTLSVSDSNGNTAVFSANISAMDASGACGLSLLYRTFDTNTSSAADNQIRPHFIIENNDNSAIDLSEITIRYWYTKEGTAGQNAWIDYAQIGSSKVTTNFVQMANPLNGANHYFEVGFTANAGSIAANATSGEIQTRFHKTNWSNYDETNDYSYNSNHGTFLSSDKITIYCNGVLAWGTEPVTNNFNDVPSYFKLTNSGISLQENLQLLPNITNNRTIIKYQLPRASPVRILLFDQMGKLMEKIVDSPQLEGEHGIELSTQDLPTGNYFVRMTVQDGVVVKRLVVIQ